MFIFGFFMFILVLLIATIDRLSIVNLVDVRSLFIILGSMLAVLLSTNSIKDFLYGFKSVLTNKPINDIKQIDKCIKLFYTLDTATIIAGLISAIISVILLLTSLDDLSTIGPATASTLFSILYSLSISIIVIRPIKYRLEKMKD